MTPEEHFDQAERAAQSFADSHDEVDARWAEVCTALGRALSEHEARRHAAGDPALIEVALRNDVAKLEQQWAERGRQLEQKERDLADLQAGYDGVAKAWTERGDRIDLGPETLDLGFLLSHQCEQLAKENDRLAAEIEAGREISDNNARALFAANEAAGYSPDQPTPLTDGLPAVPEGYCRMVIDAPVDTVFECADFSPAKVRLVDAEGDAVKVFHRRSFGRKTDYPEAPAKVETTLGPETVTVDFGGNGLGSKSRRIYGALRAAEQVWRTPKATKWRGLRGRWAVEADVASDVTEVFVRSVDYPDTDEVGVDLVTWPKELDPSRRSHDTLEILNRQRMSRKAWATHPDNIGDMEHP